MAAVFDLSRVMRGPAEVRVDGVAVGRTEGPVRVRFTPLLREDSCAHTGASPVDFVTIGLRAEVVVPMAEYVIENVLLAMPQAGYAVGYGGGYAYLGALPGARLSGSASTITIHPLARGENDASEDVTLHSAVAVGLTELEYSEDSDRIMEARFVGLADVSRSDGDLVARIAAPGRS